MVQYCNNRRKAFNGNRSNLYSTTALLFAFPQIPWLSFPNKENDNGNEKNSDYYYNNQNTLNEYGELLAQSEQSLKHKKQKNDINQDQPSNTFGSKNDNYNDFLTNEAESTMHRAVKMMEEHRRSQEAAERTSAIMEELASITVVGKSKAGGGGPFLGVNILGFGGGGDDDNSNRGGGVKVIFNGQQRPVSVTVDSKFLSSLMNMSASSSSSVSSLSSSSSSSMTTSPAAAATTTTTAATTTTTAAATATSASEELNKAIMEAMQDGYEKSGKIIEEKLKGLYEQLGLPKRE